MHLHRTKEVARGCKKLQEVIVNLIFKVFLWYNKDTNILLF